VCKLCTPSASCGAIVWIAQLRRGAESIGSKELFEDFMPHLQVQLETIEEDWIPNAAGRIERSPNERISNDVRPVL
jgi:hypothetical protein